MKIQLKITDKLSVEVEAEKHTEIFESLSGAQEIFSHPACGICQNQDVKFMVRVDTDENKYYELHCGNLQCRARLVFGSHKKGGGLYPKRKYDSLSPSEQEKRVSQKAHADKHFGYLPHNGWYIYKKEENK